MSKSFQGSFHEKTLIWNVEIVIALKFHDAQGAHDMTVYCIKVTCIASTSTVTCICMNTRGQFSIAKIQFDVVQNT